MKKGYKLGNVDATIIAEQPKFRPHIDKMRDAIASIFEVSIEDVNVKATTNEKLGFLGREEGIQAQAVVLLTSKE